MLVRNEVFRVVRALACRDYEAALELIESDLSLDGLEAAMTEYRSGHSRILTTTPARAAQFSRVSEEPPVWKVEQILTDPEALNDWSAHFTVDLARSKEARMPVLRLHGISPI